MFEPIIVTRFKKKALEAHILKENSVPNSFSYDGHDYQIIVPAFFFGNERIEAEQASKNEKIFSELVKTDSKLIKKL